MRTADTELLNRLSNRLLDAGGEPAGHASKLARVLGTTLQSNGTRPPEDPVQRAVAEQVDELVVWDRAVRADAYDSVHQMRVTVRKIRSLLKDAEASLGLSDGAYAWVLDELRELGGVLGVARDAEVLAQRYEQELDRLSPELVRGPVRERLIEGAKRRYQSGLRRSLIAMRSERYFRLLDALDSIVAESPATASGEQPASVTIDAAYKKVRKAAKAAAQAEQAAHEDHVEPAADEDQQDDEDHDLEQDRDEALHAIRKRAKRLRYTAAATGADKCPSRPRPSRRCSAIIKTAWSAVTTWLQQADAAYAAGEDTFTYGLLYQQEADLAESCRQQLDAALRRLDKSVRKA